MKLFAIIFSAALLAGLVLWATIESSKSEKESKAQLETAVRRSIEATDGLIVFAQTQRPHDLRSADITIEALRMNARNEKLPEFLRKEAAKSADEYEAALKKWR